jgi:transcriptional regulator with XRE-family HTH domain
VFAYRERLGKRVVRYVRDYREFAPCENMGMKNARPFYLKQWREYRGLSQQRLADRIESSKGYISDLERGNRRYNQDLLEALADALSCEPADLLMRDPTDPSGIWSVWDQVPTVERPRIVAVIRALMGDKTGS